MKDFEKMTTSEKMQLALKVRDWSANLDTLNKGCLTIGIDKAKENDKDYSSASLGLWHDGKIDILYSTCKPEIVKALDSVNNYQLKSIEEIGLGTNLKQTYPVRPIKYLKWTDLDFGKDKKEMKVRYKGNIYNLVYVGSNYSETVYIFDPNFDSQVYCGYRDLTNPRDTTVVETAFNDLKLEAVK